MQHVFPDFEEFDNASVRKYKRAIQWSSIARDCLSPRWRIIQSSDHVAADR